jgi:deferrochelatase/peroxidase EfeB
MLGEQEQVIGRSKGQGAPLSGGTEFSPIDLEAKGAADQPLIATNAHVRLAHSSMTKGSQLLRRGYNFVDGNDELGRLDAGLFFISFQRSPQQFINVQSSLSRDALNEYVKHVSSGIFAIPPGAASGSYVGASLFG